MKLDIQLFGYDGTITIGTEIDTSGIDEDLQKIEDMDDVDLDVLLKAKGVEVPEEEIQAIAEELNRNLQLNPDTRQFDVQIAKIKTELLSLKAVMDKSSDLGLSQADFMNMLQKVEQLKNKLIQLEQQKEKIEGKGFFAKAGSTLSDIIKKVGKWGLMMIGVSSAYSMISQTANVLAQQNDDIAAKLQAIKGSMINLLAPVAEFFVNLLYKIIAYLNVITKTFFGIDLFAKSAKSAKSAVGSAQKLRKTLAGFDEMNILNDNVSGSGGGSSGELSTPELPDTSEFEKKLTIMKLGILSITKFIKERLAIIKVGILAISIFVDERLAIIKAGILAISIFIEERLAIIKAGLVFIYNYINERLAILKLGLSVIWNNINERFTILKLGLSVIGSLISKLFTSISIGFNTIATSFNAVKEKILIGLGIIDNNKDTIIQGAELGITRIKNSFIKFANFLPNLFYTIGETIGDAIGTGFKVILNSAIAYVEKKINSFISSLNKAINVINKLPIGLSISKISSVSLPRLAKGGIINMPGRGVAVGGESGAEGVIPLTDSQQMQLLGEAIGKYITINASITNTMNGRVISRELQKIQNENSFANNN